MPITPYTMYALKVVGQKTAAVYPRCQNVDNLKVEQIVSKRTLWLYELENRALISVSEWSSDHVH